MTTLTVWSDVRGEWYVKANGAGYWVIAIDSNPRNIRMSLQPVFYHSKKSSNK